MEPKVNRSVLPEQEPKVLSVEDAEGVNIYEGGDKPNLYPMIQTSDGIFIVDGPREPGQSIDWHQHMPDLYQVLFVIEGKIRFHYEDDDEEVRTIEISGGEVAYLPGGFKNKLEIVGEEPAYFFGFEPNVTPIRINQLIGDEFRDYDPNESPINLHVDTVNDRIIEINEDAVVDQREN